MTDPNYTAIAMLVDRSGSMRAIQSDAEGGVNTYIQDQRAQGGRCDLALAQFDNEYQVVQPLGPITEAPTYSLVPRGTTALLDAMGKTITTLGEALAAKPEDQRPGKVVVVIVTDGMENASREWTRAQVFDLITAQREQYGWEFLFLAANQDAVAVGKTYGIPAGSSITYSHDPLGTQSVFAGASAATTRARSGGDVSWTDRERRAASGTT